MTRSTSHRWASRAGWTTVGVGLGFAVARWGTPGDGLSATRETAECPTLAAPTCPVVDCDPAPCEPVPCQPVACTSETLVERPEPVQTRRPPKPSLTLPRMPGTNQLRAGAKWDDALQVWALTFAYDIPAGRAQVATFYRKVLEDREMAVSRSEGVPDADGVTPLFLKGRTPTEHAHVTIRQSAEEFETIVRVIWRFYPGPGDRASEGPTASGEGGPRP